VCNHLSYLDIPVLATLTPSVFVSKREVRSWPVLGWFAQLAGTVFVHRERRSQTVEAAEAIELRLNHDALVVLFPEGTSSNGESVLPFKSSLLEPAAQNRHPLSVGFIRYEVDDGDVAEDVCYWRDMTFAPHLLNLLSKPRVRAQVRFLPQPPVSLNRKELALRLQEEILKLKADSEVRRTSAAQ
jgi:1-acyl-sn-glycerol-3-phosphate acyltransferase